MKAILENAGLSETERLAVSIICEGPQSAEGLATLLSLPHLVLANRIVGCAGHKVFDAAPEGSLVRNWRPGDWRGGWYHVIAPGWRSEVDGKFYWQLRPQVREAFIALGWYAPPSRQDNRTPSYEPKLEGAEVLRLLSIHERDPVLRSSCLAIHGYTCFICGCNLGVIYGALGEGFIQVHHIEPLGSRGHERKTDPRTDLIPVCPNCHAMIHRGGVTRSPEEVRNAMNTARGQQDGAANGSKPVRSEANRTSAAAGSRR
jgi:hypothetical protein